MNDRRPSSDHDDDKSSLLERNVSEKSFDDRERMTPAFNNRIKIDQMRQTLHGKNKGDTP